MSWQTTIATAFLALAFGVEAFNLGLLLRSRKSGCPLISVVPAVAEGNLIYDSWGIAIRIGVVVAMAVIHSGMPWAVWELGLTFIQRTHETRPRLGVEDHE